MPPATVPAHPVVPFQKEENSTFIAYAIAQFTPLTEGATPVAFRSATITDSATNEITPSEEPDENGILRPFRRDLTKSEETYKIKTKDMAKVLEFFGGRNKIIDCKVRFWKRDAKDAPGTCRMASEEFPATVEREGELASGDKKPDEVTIKITSLHSDSVQWFWKPTLEAEQP